MTTRYDMLSLRRRPWSSWRFSTMLLRRWLSWDFPYG